MRLSLTGLVLLSSLLAPSVAHAQSTPGTQTDEKAAALEGYNAVCNAFFADNEGLTAADAPYGVEELCACVTDYMEKLDVEGIELVTTLRQERLSGSEPRENTDAENNVANYEDSGMMGCNLELAREAGALSSTSPQ